MTVLPALPCPPPEGRKLRSSPPFAPPGGRRFLAAPLPLDQDAASFSRVSCSNSARSGSDAGAS